MTKVWNQSYAGQEEHLEHLWNNDETVTVIRNKKEAQIRKDQIGLGEVIKIQPGTIIPCDGLLIKGKKVVINEEKFDNENQASKKAILEE